jgi:hypothetical protein
MITASRAAGRTEHAIARRTAENAAIAARAAARTEAADREIAWAMEDV